MKKLVGRFYLRLTDSKNLIGEFSNNHSEVIYTEGAIRKCNNGSETAKASEDSEFVGAYLSTWYDDNEDGKSVFAELDISKKSKNIFYLGWHLVKNNGQRDRQIFWGEGMLADGMLIGDYRDFRDLENA